MRKNLDLLLVVKCANFRYTVYVKGYMMLGKKFLRGSWWFDTLVSVAKLY
jgi:hypothetical protein